MHALNASLPDDGVMSTSVARFNPASTCPPAGFPRAISTSTEFGPGGDPSIRALIAAHPTLGKLNDEDRSLLLRWSKFRNVKRRETICCQGSLPNAVFVVLEGYLKASLPLANGSEVLLDILSPGDHAGELLVLQDHPHEANITALTPCRLLMIDARHFRQVFGCRPEGLLAILRSTAEQLQRSREQLLDLRAMSAPARLAKALIFLARLPAPAHLPAPARLPAPEGKAREWLPLRLSQSELGALTGLCREVVNKTLGIWRDAGAIEMSGGRVTSVDVAAISGMMEEEVFRETEESFPLARRQG
jgi:CRP-like cAMP-binding protein